VKIENYIDIKKNGKERKENHLETGTIKCRGICPQCPCIKEHEGRVKAESKVELLEQQNRRLQNDLRKAEYYKGRLSEREQQK
jgi:hypothetical protein